MRKVLLLAIVLSPLALFGQGATTAQRIVISNSLGRPLGGVSVEVCTTIATTAPSCIGAASIFSDSGLTIPITCTGPNNCLTSDSLGQVPTFFAAPGYYCYTVNGSYVTDTSCKLIALYSATPGTAVITNPSGTQTISGFGLTLSNTAPFIANGTATFNGVVTVPGAVGASGGITHSATGVFTNTQMNEYVQSLLGGCTASEYNTVQTGNFSTDALTGCVSIPSSSTVHQANAVAGYATNTAAQLSGGGAVGGYFQGRAISNTNGAVWGVNSLVQDTVGLAGTQMIGNEVDVNIFGTPARAWGLLISGASTGTVPGSAAGIEVRAPGYALSNGLKWGAGLNMPDGTAVNAINLGATGSGNGVNSMPIQFNSRDAGGVSHNVGLQSLPGGVLGLTPAYTVAQLPSASANAGGIAYVTDSTAIASEGQTCAGSSTNKALAFSNGSVWKCF